MDAVQPSGTPLLMALFFLLFHTLIALVFCVIARPWFLSRLSASSCCLITQVDGWIARRYPSQQSKVGAIIDPIADKALVGTTFATMTWVGLLPLPLAGLVLLRDAGLMAASFVLRYYSLKPHVGGHVTWKQYWDFSLPSATVTPTTISKLNTFVQLATVFCSLAAPVVGLADHAALHALW